ncbi:hypothetical protein DFR86_06000 [Acidianus sulfidivorans JP7]|uniref:Uncharacterized protein n=1 Tax=Acidianus sulfidivorans JP7 TaxID=619593 RepID=A0A2U9IMA1_9CREN|nr:hypothetical protein [Acidianus sulfidivorans]AWR97156.1 hypothetical protein DFR86_06000 [Acidianus sulfidivorans JP7]
MSNSRFESYPKYIVEFEEDIDKLKLSTSDDAKKLIDLAGKLSNQMEEEINKVLNEISINLDKDIQDQINQLRNLYNSEKDKKISEIRSSVNKNFEKAVSYLLDAIKGAYK